MGWKATNVSEQRMRFVIRASSGKERMTALCREFGISRPTGYLWRRRYRQAASVTAVCERSRRPKQSPRRTESWKEQRVVALRQQMGWGAKKLRVLLQEEEGIPLPVRTIHRILERHGLVSERGLAALPLRFDLGPPRAVRELEIRRRAHASVGGGRAGYVRSGR